MPRRPVKPVTASTTLPSAQAGTAGGIKIYLSGVFVAVEAYLDANSDKVAPQPINGLSLSNSGVASNAPIFLPTGNYRFVNFPPGWTGGLVGLTFEDPVAVT